MFLAERLVSIAAISGHDGSKDLLSGGLSHLDLTSISASEPSNATVNFLLPS
jgi:hypothetical protein